jgi:hypothetical protein
MINVHRNNRLSGYHVLHMKIDGKVYTKSVDQWIVSEPELLYKAVMRRVKCCVQYPSMAEYSPSLHFPVMKKLELAVKKINPRLILSKNIRKARKQINGAKNS